MVIRQQLAIALRLTSIRARSTRPTKDLLGVSRRSVRRVKQHVHAPRKILYDHDFFVPSFAATSGAVEMAFSMHYQRVDSALHRSINQSMHYFPEMT
jgi:hypothetical protein